MEKLNNDLAPRYPYVRVDGRSGEVRYLGYKIELTACEFEIFRVLYNSDVSLNKKEIAALADESLALGEKSVAVHICSINRKSERLGGRKLVESQRKSGYFINKNS